MHRCSTRDRVARAAACLATALACATAACSGPAPSTAAEAGTFPDTPLMTVTSSSGSLVLAVRTSPQPPSVGTDEVEYTITRASDGTPVDGLTITVNPVMPSMGHGTAEATVTPEGGGVYLVSNLYLFMQGVWSLNTTISGPMSDDAAPDLQIQ